MKLSANAKNAVKIGSLCAVSYFAAYIARNILSAVTPQLVEAGFTEAYIGRMSSLFFMAYAATTIGWGWLILVWFGLMIVGIVVVLAYKK